MKKEFEKVDKLLDKREKEINKQVLNYYRETLKEIRSRIAYYNEKGLFNQADMFKYNRITKLEDAIVKEIGKLTGKTNRTLQSSLINMYQDSYLRTAFILENEAKVNLGFTLLNTETIKKVVGNPFDRIGWKDRNKVNQAEMVRKLKEEISNGLIQGKSYRDISKNVKNRLNIGADKSIRIVQTESHRIKEDSRFEGMKKAESKGVNMKKRWLSTLDSRTRDRHRRLDGETIGIDETYSNGLMYPGDPRGRAKEVINCRCTQVSIIEGYEPKVRRARDKQGKGEIIEYENYEEWRKGRVD